MNIAALGTWRKPPLAYVVAELAISPYYTMGEAIPTVQSALRGSFPRTVEGKELVIDGPTPTQHPIWRLMSADQTHGVQLSARAISLHATQYSNSANFLKRWEEVLTAVSVSLRDAFVERAGLRYIDLIVPTDDHEPTAYIDSRLQGLELPGGHSTGSMWGAAFQFGEDTSVNLRLGAPSPLGLLLPPEFSTLPLQKPQVMIEAEARLQSSRTIGFVDTDCGRAVQQVFNVPQITSIYSELQKLTSTTFQATLSEFAKEEWK